MKTLIDYGSGDRLVVYEACGGYMPSSLASVLRDAECSTLEELEKKVKNTNKNILLLYMGGDPTTVGKYKVHLQIDPLKLKPKNYKFPKDTFYFDA
ncbi:MAG: hypothetical protein GY756_09930 [bacterium]|nr:hypothetical protein [bacterium]